MPNGHNFQHLPLLRRESGPAKLTGGGSTADQTIENRTNRAEHSRSITTSGISVVANRQRVETQRQTESLPTLPPGIPLLLEIDPGLEVDDLRHYFDFEIVAEEEAGYVIVASNDLDLSDFLDAVDRFAASSRQEREGTGTLASVHRLDDDPEQKKRLELLLSETLLQEWPNLTDNREYHVDIGVTCLGTRDIPKTRPKQPERRDGEIWTTGTSCVSIWTTGTSCVSELCRRVCRG